MLTLPALRFSVAFVGAFFNVGFSVCGSIMRLTTQESFKHNWTDIASLKVHEPTQRAWLGKYKHIRSRLDYNFHNAYSRERVMLQDQIIDSMLTEHDVLAKDLKAGGDGKKFLEKAYQAVTGMETPKVMLDDLPESYIRAPRKRKLSDAPESRLIEQPTS